MSSIGKEGLRRNVKGLQIEARVILRQPLISLTQHVADRVYTDSQMNPINSFPFSTKEEKKQKWESVMKRPVTARQRK